MKEIEIVAKSKEKDPVTGKQVEKEVGKGKCPQYDTLKEAVAAFGDDGEKKVLAIVNMQVKIRALDALRAGTSSGTMALAKMIKGASPEAQAKIMALLAGKK